LISTCRHYVQFATEYTQTEQVIDTVLPIAYDDLDQVKQYLSEIENMFLFQIQSLIDCIQILGISESVRLGHLVSQLDYNGYYQNLMPQPLFILHPTVPNTQ
jgi:hypothetical protein